jgi:hypothetical protein
MTDKPEEIKDQLGPSDNEIVIPPIKTEWDDKLERTTGERLLVLTPSSSNTVGRDRWLYGDT